MRACTFAARNFSRHIWLSTVAITIMTLAVLSLTSVFALGHIASALITDVKERIDISLYFPPSTSNEAVHSLERTIQRMTGVRSTTVVSADFALSAFREKHGGDVELGRSLSELQDNPFGPAIVVKANELTEYPAILKQLTESNIMAATEKVEYEDYAEVIENLAIVEQKIRYAGLFFAAFFALIAGLTVGNSVRMAIYAQREELKIMKLVGATSGFIRAPFLIEGIGSAFIATLIGWVLMGLLAQGFSSSLESFFSGIPFSFSAYLRTNAVSLWVGEFLLLALLNSVSASMSIRKYINI